MCLRFGRRRVGNSDMKVEAVLLGTDANEIWESINFRLRCMPPEVTSHKWAVQYRIIPVVRSSNGI